MKIFLKAVITLIAVLIFLKACGPYLGGPNPLVGKFAPDFTLDTLSGKKASMCLAREGRPAVIFFWATWCPHCRTQLAEFQRQKEDVARKGIEVFLVDIAEDPRTVGAYCDDNNITHEVFLDQAGVVADTYKVFGVPAFFYVDQDGVVVAAGQSLRPDYEQILFGLGP